MPWKFNVFTEELDYYESPATDAPASDSIIDINGSNGVAGSEAAYSRGDHMHGVAANAIDDTHIDWGTGANQVSAVDIVIADAGTIITATEVEGALQENRTAINLNTTHRGSDGSDHSKVTDNETAIALNTTHRSSDGTDHADVVTNTADIATNVTAIALNTTHRGSDGSDHSFLDQAVTTTGTPTFDDLTITTPVNIYALSHDSFTDFVANEHIDWTADQGAVNINAGNYTDTDTTYTAGTGLTLTGTAFSCDITQYTDELAQDAVGGILDDGTIGNIVFTYDDAGGTISAVTQDGEIDHDALLNFAANEHIDWTGASAGTIHASNYVDSNTTYTAGTGLTLTGTAFSCDITQYTDELAQDAIGTILTDTATIDFTYTDATPSITADVKPGGVDHDALLNFVANEHIDWTGASAGTIHASNYVDNNTTYTAGDHLTLTGTDFDVDDDFVLNAGDTMTGPLVLESTLIASGSITYYADADNQVSLSGSKGAVNSVKDNTSHDMFSVVISSGGVRESYARWQAKSDGRLNWGGGVAVVDTRLSRGAADRVDIGASGAGDDLVVWGNIGIGMVPAAGVQLDMTGSAFPIAQYVNVSAATGDAHSTNRVITESTSDMVDGFGGGIVFAIKDDASAVENIATVYGVRDGADDSGALLLTTYDAGTRKDALFIDSSQNVGIGTKTPAPVAFTDLTLEIAGATSPSLTINDTGQAEKYALMALGARLGLKYGSAVEIISFEGSGNVGINEVSPSAKLEVGGDVLVKDKIAFTQDDKNEYIDSLADGYMDYGATTAHRFNTEVELNGDLNHDGSNVGFYGTAPIAQAVLATGAGATVDSVITALQNLGLVKQS